MKGGYAHESWSIMLLNVKGNVFPHICGKFKGLLSSGSTVFTCRPVADNKQYVASLHAGHKKGVISVRDRTQFPTSRYQ